MKKVFLILALAVVLTAAPALSSPERAAAFMGGSLKESVAIVKESMEKVVKKIEAEKKAGAPLAELLAAAEEIRKISDEIRVLGEKYPDLDEQRPAPEKVLDELKRINKRLLDLASKDMQNSEAAPAFREARNEDERVAMQFVQALWEEDYDTVVKLTDLDSLYPAAPGAGGNNILTEIILRRCVASTGYNILNLYKIGEEKPRWFSGTHSTWKTISSSSSKDNKSQGIVDEKDIAETIVAHGIWDEEENNSGYGNRLDVFRLVIKNGKVTAWDFNEHTGAVQDKHTRFFVPANVKVTFRGQMITPYATGYATSYDKGLWDIYRLDKMQSGKFEEISADFGGGLGVIKDWIALGGGYTSSKDEAVTGYNVKNNMSSAGSKTSVNMNNQFFTNLRGLIITGEVYRKTWKEVQDAAEKMILTVFAALQSNDFSKITNMLCDYERIEKLYQSYNSRNGYLNQAFKKWIQDDQKDSWAKFTWKTEAYATSAITKDTLKVWNNVTMSTGGGNEYQSTVELHLRYMDGQWKLAYWSGPLLSRNPKDWKKVK